MAKEKKSAKAGKKAKSVSANAYKATHRRYFNKIKRVRRHMRKQQERDMNTATFLVGLQGILAMDYIRGSEAVRNLHERHFGGNRHTG